MSDSCLIVTKYKKGILSCIIENNKIDDLSFYNEQLDCQLGDIFVAKVLNVVPNINAAFIDYLPGKRGFMSIDSNWTPVLINRTYDGRILAGDEILVQMEKEAIRTKEPVFTMNLSIAGKYCVVTNANQKKCVSTKIEKHDRELLQQQIPDNTPYGIIVRTNAQQLIERSENGLDLLKEECRQLIQKMKKLLNEGIHRTCYSKIYQAPAAYLTDIRDKYAIESYEKIITDDKGIYEQLQNFLNIYLPEKTKNISFYQDSTYPLHKLYSIETKLQELLDTKVWLKSGAYLVIEQTEAMYVIDVNSGKNTKKKQTDDFWYQINKEAATEIMRQLKLRNLSGMILVDFINMESEESKQKLMSYLRKLAKADRVPTSIVDMTALELIEITRKKTKKSLKSQMLDNCELKNSKI